MFANCNSLAAVSIDTDNEYLTYYNGAIYNGNMTMLYQVLPAREGDNYVMPDTVESIDTYAFWNLQNAKNVMVSDNIVSYLNRSQFRTALECPWTYFFHTVRNDHPRECRTVFKCIV